MKTKRGKEAAEEMSKANRGWFTMFKERNHILNIKIQGEVTSVDVEPASSDLEVLAKTIRQKIKDTHDTSNLIPNEVRAYIDKYNIYGVQND